MTQREFFVAITNADVTDELKDFAAAAIEKLDATNEAKRVKAAEKRASKETERAPMRQAIVNVMTDEFKTASTLLAAAGLEITPQSVPSLLKPLIEEGVVLKGEVKVTGKGTQRGYALA